jgi:hypothetical protein
MFRHFEIGEEFVRICLPSVPSRSTLRALIKLQRPKSGTSKATVSVMSREKRKSSEVEIEVK